MADEFIICVSQHQALFTNDTDWKDDNIRQSITDHLGFANGE